MGPFGPILLGGSSAHAFLMKPAKQRQEDDLEIEAQCPEFDFKDHALCETEDSYPHASR